MDSIILWCRQIFIVSILSNIVLHLVPSDKYEKYIKYICGIIMFAICVEPILNILPKSFSLSELYKNIVQTSDIKKLQTELKYKEASSDSLISEYILKIKKDIESFALDEGLYPINTEVVIDTDEDSETFGTITKIQLTVSEQQYTDNDNTSSTISNSDIEKIKKIGIQKINVNDNNDTQSNSIENNKITSLKQRLSDFYTIPQDKILIYN